MPNPKPRFPDTLRAMSIHFPFAWAIVHRKKKEEYRTKRTHYRGIFLIHASGSKASDDAIDEYRIPEDQIVRKAIIGAVELVDCVEDDEYDGYIYKLKKPIIFERVIPVPGHVSVFWPANTPERVQAFNAAWKQIGSSRSK